jgi:hypothetical protein
VRALVAERAEDDPGATLRLVEIVERAFDMNEAQRQFLEDMTTVGAPLSAPKILLQ